LFFPAKYAAALAGTQTAPFVVANGVEARLIQAEVALHAGNASWLTILNTLRTNGNFTTAPDPVDPSVIDTTWTAGTGGVDNLRPLGDPGASLSGQAAVDARVTLLFQERASWLFLTGHRQGDLRRLIRQYGRTQDHVYPIGLYTAPGHGQYGVEVTVPVPPTESPNPYFTGCVDRNA
jgi:hypothetical protein